MSAVDRATEWLATEWAEAAERHESPSYEDEVRIVFESIDEEELARAIHATHCPDPPHGPRCPFWDEDHESARAVVAHLTKGDESDE